MIDQFNKSVEESFDAWLADDSTHWIGDQDAAWQAWMYVNEQAVEPLNGEIARLKAENEALRKYAPHPDIIWCDCGDGHHANSYGAGFMAANEGVCENCDAANLSAKQSASERIAAALGRHEQEINAKAFSMKREGMVDAQKACDRIAGDGAGRTDRERKGAGECSAAIRALIAAMSEGEQP